MSEKIDPLAVVKLDFEVTEVPKYLWISEKIEIMIFRESGKIRAINAICPHMGAQLVKKEASIFCPWHGLDFSKTTLQCDHPKYKSIREYDCTITDNTLTIFRPTGSQCTS